MIKVVSIKHGENIFPEAFIGLNINNTEIMVLRASGELEVVSSNKNYHIENNKLTVLSHFGRFKLKNKSRFPVFIQGFVIDTSTDGVNRSLWCLNSPEYENVFEKIMKLKVHEVNYEKLFSDLLFQLNPSNILTSEKSIDKKGGRIDPRLIKVNRFIRMNYDKTISLQTLSEIAHCSPTYLSNSYSKVFNIPPIFYLNKIRVDKAKLLLQQSDLSICEIAKIVGYESTSQFCSIFKRYFYETPTEYRKLLTVNC